MSRISEELQTEAAEVSRQLADTLGNSPLEPVAQRLIELLAGVSTAAMNGRPVSELRSALSGVREIVSMLPGTWGNRFHFDAGLIGDVLHEWESAGVRVSRAVVPRYTGAWGLGRVPMPSEDGQRAHVIRVVTLPGEDRLGDIDLSDYPWLFHELAHDAFYGVGHNFREDFEATLVARLRALRIRAAADIGGAAHHASQHLDQLREYWRPRRNQRDWAHEIATDVAALWAVGPAFVLRFTQLLVAEAHRASSAGDQHPSYLTRAEALASAAERLGWSNEAWALDEEVRQVRSREDLDRSQLVYADPELIEGAVAAALAAVAALSIPRMTSERFAELRAASAQDPTGLTGTALVACAAICRNNCDGADYQRWHECAIGAED
jgi:hypothetical protein